MRLHVFFEARMYEFCRPILSKACTTTAAVLNRYARGATGKFWGNFSRVLDSYLYFSIYTFWWRQETTIKYNSPFRMSQVNISFFFAVWVEKSFFAPLRPVTTFLVVFAIEKRRKRLFLPRSLYPNGYKVSFWVWTMGNIVFGTK